MAKIELNRVDLSKLEKRLKVLDEFGRKQADRIIQSGAADMVEYIVDDVPVDTGNLQQGVDSYKEVNGTVVEAIALSESEDYGFALEKSGKRPLRVGADGKRRKPAKIPFFYPNVEKGWQEILVDLDRAVKKVLK